MLQSILCLCLVPVAFGLFLKSAQTGPSFCHGLDCPKFTVKRTYKAGYELRHYEASKWVMTNMTTMEFTEDDNRMMFYKLFHYISGNNTAHSKIPMTAPVLREVWHGPGPTCESTFLSHFMVPFAFQTNTPEPTDPDVYLKEIPAMDVYVRSFGGRPQPQDFMNELQTLADQIADDTKYEGLFYFFAGYDGPYTISGRHNEVWLKALKT